MDTFVPQRPHTLACPGGSICMIERRGGCMDTIINATRGPQLVDCRSLETLAPARVSEPPSGKFRVIAGVFDEEYGFERELFT